MDERSTEKIKLHIKAQLENGNFLNAHFIRAHERAQGKNQSEEKKRLFMFYDFGIPNTHEIFFFLLLQ